MRVRGTRSNPRRVRAAAVRAAAWILLLALPVASARAAQTTTAVRPLPNADATLAPAAPAGENQLTLADASEVCCRFEDGCAPSGGPYDSGDVITINTYWTDTLPDPVPGEDWVVDWTLGLRIPNGNIVQLFTDEAVNFGRLDGFAPGTVLEFCVAGILKLPSACQGAAVVTQGHGVTSPAGTLPAGPSDPLGGDDALTCN